MCSVTVPIRLDTSGDPTVAEWLDRVRTRTLDAQAHQDLPFERIVELLAPARDLAHNPVAQVMFVWNPASPEGAVLPRLGGASSPRAHAGHRVAGG